jgi:hypothetical protein
MTHREPAAESDLVSPEMLEGAIDRFAAKYKPYSSEDLDGFLSDFDAFDLSGLQIIERRKTGDPRSMLKVVVRGGTGAMETVEVRWRDTLRLAGESAHTIEGDQLRFVSRGRVSGSYVTGTVMVEVS